MSEHTSIGWTDHTFNPWWGCIRVSPGCEHCYAETFAVKRLGLPIWGPAKTTERRFFGDKHWNEPLRWNRKAEQSGGRARVFCASMADVFEDHPALPPHRARLWELIEQTPSLDWQLLTKRPENVMQMVPASWRARFPANVWLGTSVEDQRRADERIPHLLRVPARIRFLSCEPLLGPVNLGLVGTLPSDITGTAYAFVADYLHWIIIGGESGRNARPFDLQWAYDIVRECYETDVACFVKQMGSHSMHHGDRVQYTGKGEDPDEWLPDLRTRQFPRIAAAPLSLFGGAA